MSKIDNIYARQILDSRGNPTVEVEVTLSSGVKAQACVPSGASTGQREALELRDNDKNVYLGKGVLKACEHVNKILAPKICGMDVTNQKLIDETMIELDGTEFKSHLGANALLGVSMACARAGSYEKKMPLYKYLREVLKAPFQREGFIMPTPLMNIINGGEHAANNLDIQEFMIAPQGFNSFSDTLRAGVEIFHHLKKVLTNKKLSTNVGDEGGFAPNLDSHEEALELMKVACESAGYELGDKIFFSLDAASSEFHDKGSYQMQGKNYSSQEMIDYYQSLMKKFPIYSIEDGLDESDHDGWKSMTSQLKTILVGDDLFVTNPSIFQKGIDNQEANAILIKVNQIGTLTETFKAIELAFEHHYKVIISHRSGETSDHFISDLAVATNAGHIKTGSASRSDRIEKYNQLLRIEESL